MVRAASSFFPGAKWNRPAGDLSYLYLSIAKLVLEQVWPVRAERLLARACLRARVDRPTGLATASTPAPKRAIDATPTLPPKLREETRNLEKRLGEINRALRGDAVMRAPNEPTRASISARLTAVAGSLRQTTGRPTRAAMENYQIASAELAAEIPKLRRLVETDIRALEKQLDTAGAPPTPGRLPDWKK